MSKPSQEKKSATGTQGRSTSKKLKTWNERSGRKIGLPLDLGPMPTQGITKLQGLNEMAKLEASKDSFREYIQLSVQGREGLGD